MAEPHHTNSGGSIAPKTRAHRDSRHLVDFGHPGGPTTQIWASPLTQFEGENTWSAHLGWATIRPYQLKKGEPTAIRCLAPYCESHVGHGPVPVTTPKYLLYIILPHVEWVVTKVQIERESTYKPTILRTSRSTIRAATRTNGGFVRQPQIKRTTWPSTCPQSPHQLPTAGRPTPFAVPTT